MTDPAQTESEGVNEVMESAAGNRPVDVIVVGGGVSGCACAAALAQGGAQVLVMSSALDVVGLPGYGPTVESDRGRWEDLSEAFSALHPSLRSAWLSTAAAPESGDAVLVVDRRAVSIETKRMLELLPGLQFRQGLVSDIRLVSSGAPDEPSSILSATGTRHEDEAVCAVEVETAFGEVVRARTVVLAPGLGLGGTIALGEEVVPGGRYGEVPADELQEALTGLGVRFESAELEIGPRYAGGSPLVCEGLGDADRFGRRTRLIDLRSLQGSLAATYAADEVSGEQASPGGVSRGAAGLAMGASCVGGLSLGKSWPDEYPPAPHWSEELAFRTMALPGPSPHASGSDEGCDGRSGGDVDDACALGGLVPDGRATAEFYVCPVETFDGVPASDEASSQQGGDEGFGMMVQPLSAADDGSWQRPIAHSREAREPASRLGYLVRASVAAGLEKEGRLPGLGSRVWVAGRAAGATNYVESLWSGMRVAEGVLVRLNEDARCEGGVR